MPTDDLAAIVGARPTTDVVLHRPDAVLRGTVTGRGPTVLLLHAGGERREVWAPVSTMLANRGLRAVAFDQRSHGDSSGTATDLAPFADDAAAMVQAERPPIVVIGASLGGLAAIAALADPAVTRRVAGLVLVDVVPDPDPDRALVWLGGRGLLDHRRPLVEAILARSAQLRSVLAGVELPLVLVRGGPKSPITDADVDRLLALKPATRVEHVRDAGHLVARDNPHELGCIIADVADSWLSLRP